MRMCVSREPTHSCVLRAVLNAYRAVYWARRIIIRIIIVSDAYVRAWAGAGASRGSILNQVRMTARICAVLAAYYGRIRLIRDPHAQYALNTQFFVR